jgi:putative glutamine amidotransferase
VQHVDNPARHENKAVAQAHAVLVEPGSRLAGILALNDNRKVDVNSSHHQSAAIIGRDLRAVASCPDDDIVEAVEGTTSNHFVVAVQWHPERSLDEAPSQALFRALVAACE